MNGTVAAALRISRDHLVVRGVARWHLEKPAFSALFVLSVIDLQGKAFRKRGFQGALGGNGNFTGAYHIW